MRKISMDEEVEVARELDDLNALVDEQGRVIARLLDGWWPSMFPKQMWKHSTKIVHQTITKTEPMSDGEAAVIEAHQERQS